MKKILFATAIIITACNNTNSKYYHISLSDSVAMHEKYLDYLIKELEDVYEKQIDLARHSYDDSIEHYQNELELKISAGTSQETILRYKYIISTFELKAAKKAYDLGSIHAKKEQDEVWKIKFKEQKEKEISDLDDKFEKREISEDELNKRITSIQARSDSSPVTIENALVMSRDYHLKKYKEGLDKQQKMIENAIDSAKK